MGHGVFDCGGIRLYLSVPEGPSFGGRATICYPVARVAAGVAELEQRGATFDDGPHVVHRDEERELRMAFFRDADDNDLALMGEVPVAASGAADTCP